MAEIKPLPEIPSAHMKRGDIIIVEPKDGGNFEAEVIDCYGWGLVNGVMDWLMERRDDGQQFTYSIHIETQVQVVARAS